MKKILTAKHLSLLMLLSLFGGNAQARHYDDGYYVGESRDCCPSSCYECSCNPLYCGAWDLQVHGGVNPIVWRHRGEILGISCFGEGAFDPVRVLFNEVPKFSTLFKTPWIVGGQVGYHVSDNARVYAEFNFSRARAKDVELTTNAVPAPTPINLTLTRYSLFEGYVGARYYFDRWCDRVSFFLGAKVGATRHKSIRGDLEITVLLPEPAPAVVVSDRNVFERHSVVSGGANFGFDVCFCGNWSLVVTGEVVASCAPHSERILLPANQGLFPNTVSNIFIGHIGTELRFPVTVGVRYSF